MYNFQGLSFCEIEAYRQFLNSSCLGPNGEKTLMKQRGCCCRHFLCGRDVILLEYKIAIDSERQICQPTLTPRTIFVIQYLPCIDLFIVYIYAIHGHIIQTRTHTRTHTHVPPTLTPHTRGRSALENKSTERSQASIGTFVLPSVCVVNVGGMCVCVRVLIVLK